MGYSLNVDGMDEISRMLSDLDERAPAAAASALYDGAGVMRDKIQQGTKDIAVAPFRFAPPGTKRAPSPEEKQVLLDHGVGIAKFDRDGTEVSTSVGLSGSGYVDWFGKQKPVALIANSINSGTSFMNKQPYFRKAVSSGSAQVEQTIVQALEKSLGEITGGKT